MSFEELAPKPVATPRRKVISNEQRRFIAWDGEGISLDGEDQPQSYVMFTSSEGYIEDKEGLDTFRCLDFIIEIGMRYPRAFHVAFAFTYDANMILQYLSAERLRYLHQHGYVRLKNGEDVYTVKFAKGKWFSVTKIVDGKKVTVRIDDVFSFFATSFIKAYEGICGAAPEVLVTGKAQRGAFSVEHFDEMKEYALIEIQLMRELAEKLRSIVYGAGLRITQWHGPGALATYVMKQHGIKEHMQVFESHIRQEARYAYAGGRFRTVQSGEVQWYDIQLRYQLGIPLRYNEASFLVIETVEESRPTKDSLPIETRIETTRVWSMARSA